MEHPEIKNKKIIVFDLDDTLSKPKTEIDDDMKKLLCDLLSKKKVAIVSGGRFSTHQKQVVARLECVNSFTNLHFFSANGTSYNAFAEGNWHEVYSDPLSDYDKDRIKLAFTESLKEINFPTEQLYGEQVEDRVTQITFSGLGQLAPLEKKVRWDPDGSRRRLIISHLERKLPDFEIHTGGTTSIDVTPKGMTKVYAINKIQTLLGFAKEDIAFVGDAMSPEGNDFPVIATGVTTVAVKNPEETKELIRYILSE